VPGQIKEKGIVTTPRDDQQTQSGTAAASRRDRGLESKLDSLLFLLLISFIANQF
jgi:hypothetical protein